MLFHNAVGGVKWDEMVEGRGGVVRQCDKKQTGEAQQRDLITKSHGGFMTPYNYRVA